jgi:ribosome-associated protein
MSVAYPPRLNPPADHTHRPELPPTAFVVTAPRGQRAWIADDDLRWSFTRSSGPGGQNVNKVNTRAELRMRPEVVRGLDDAGRARFELLAGKRLTREGELIFTADTHRSQQDNRQACLDRLRALLLMALTPPKKRKATKPSKGSRQRRLDSKRKESDKKSARRWSDD